MDRAQVRVASARVNEVLAGLSKELGLSFSTGSIRFDSNGFTTKLTATASASDGSSRTKEAVDFETHAMSFGLKPSDLGHKFTHGGDEFTITGLKPRSSKYPILAKNRMGKTFKFPIYATGLAKVEVMDYMRR
jgi:hypothetical protein